MHVSMNFFNHKTYETIFHIYIYHSVYHPFIFGGLVWSFSDICRVSAIIFVFLVGNGDFGIGFLTWIGRKVLIDCVKTSCTGVPDCKICLNFV